MSNQFQVDLLRYQLRRKEGHARAVPYISFILTHAALVLFLLLSFFSDQLFGSINNSLAIKIALALLAVVLLASEWIYAIVNSRRWKRDIQLLLQLEEEQRYREEQEKIRRQEELLAAEQFKNRVLHADLQRQRNPSGFQGQGMPPSVRSVRPDRSATPIPTSGNIAQLPFPPLNTNAPSY